MRFKQAPAIYQNLNPSSHRPHILDVDGLNSYQCRSYKNPLHMKSSIVQWAVESALQTDDVAMVTSQKAAAGHLGGVASAWQHMVI